MYHKLIRDRIEEDAALNDFDLVEPQPVEAVEMVRVFPV